MRPTPLSPLLAILLCACTPDPKDTANPVIDEDGDGWSETDDCNDGDAAIHPQAWEMCDGVDNDCDGLLDDDDGEIRDASTFWPDADGDGYGDGAAPVQACTPPAGHVADDSDCDDGDASVNPGAAPEACTDPVDRDCDGGVAWADADADGVAACEDCDDGDATAFPGAPEACDGADDDCDGETDEDATDAPTWYLDGDGDGHGLDGYVIVSCTAPDGYVDVADDCDDFDGTAFPGAPEACDGADDDCDGAIDEEPADAPTWYADTDADGYGDPAAAVAACDAPPAHLADATDCDDTRAEVNPGAAEVCGGLDDDCDGTVDEDDAIDAPTWYRDADGDGYGDAAVTHVACAAPGGWLTDATDCDDTRPDAFPGATEVCNGLDEDCDGVTDEDDADDAPTWYADADADGWGDATSPRVACTALPGEAGNAEDCDDADPAVSPGAPELCNGLDDDCDGTMDEDDAADAITWTFDGDGDGWGIDIDFVVSCEAPEDYVADGGDCDDTDVTLNPGVPEVCDEIDNDCDGVPDDDALDAPTWYPDADADGFGAADAPFLSCTVPTGAVSDASDCDDTRADVNPAGTEVCDGLDDDCDDVVDEDDAADAATWYRDADADGFGDVGLTHLACAASEGWVADSSDCDDSLSIVNPGAPETCDALDDDCDGLVDEDDAVDAPTWYADGDGDGWGDPALSAVTCEEPLGFVALSGDCDDASAGVNPDAVEACDAEDDDCDGVVDEDDAADAGSWYTDADGDGHGDPDDVERSCAPRDGRIATGDDCDDGDASAFPGASETCDGADNDCDGVTDEDAAVDAPTWYKDADGDGFGALSSARTACSRPTGHVSDGTDCDDASAATYPGAAEVCGDGLVNDCGGTANEAVAACLAGDLDLSAATARLLGEASGDQAASAVAGGGDVNGDGWDDVFVASKMNGRASTEAGAAWLVLGPVEGDLDLGAADAIVTGEVTKDHLGSSVALAGDVNRDGYDDLLVGAVDHDSGGNTAGAAWLVLGPVSGTLSASAADGRYVGELTYDEAGGSVAGAGDLDGDGYADVLVGAVGDDSGGSKAGIAYVIRGARTGTVDLSLADAFLIGEKASDSAGGAVAGAGDTDADGLDDVIIGATGVTTGGSGAGAAYVLTGPLSGEVDLSAADAILVGEDASDYAGDAVAGAGDVNADGYDDVLVGAYGDDTVGSDAGAAYLVLGPVVSLDLSAADAKLTGAAKSDYTSRDGVAGAGDVNDDGFADLLIGAPRSNDGGSWAGAACVVLGPVSGTVGLAGAALQLIGENSNDYAGSAVAPAGDLDADGYADLLVGAYSNDAGGTDAGVAYLVAASRY